MTLTPGSQQYWQAPQARASAATQPSTVPQQQPNSILNDPELRQEAQAAIGAYQELGHVNPEYEDAVVASFLARLDQQLAQRAVETHAPIPQATYAQAAVTTVIEKTKRGKTTTVSTSKPVNPKTGQSVGSFGQIIALLSVTFGLAIPLTAIAASMIGLVGFVIAWIGITVVGFTGFMALLGTKPDEIRKAIGK